MSAKSQQLQIRVSPEMKARLRALAKAAGLSVSSYVLRQVLPEAAQSWSRLVRQLAGGEDERYVLAAINELLAGLAPGEFAGVVAAADLSGLSSVQQNLLAGMVELTAQRHGVEPPAWAAEVAPLERPYFGTSLVGLRLHLLKNTSPVFKSRNVFVDSSVGDRV